MSFSRTFFLSYFLLLIFVSAAAAQVPGRNGSISYVYNISGMKAAGVATFTKWNTGERLPNYQFPTRTKSGSLYGPRSAIRFSSDGLHFLVDSGFETMLDNPAVQGFSSAIRSEGSYVGVLSPGVSISGPFFPGFFEQNQMCMASAEPLLALADGTFLWKTDYGFHNDADRPCNHVTAPSHQDVSLLVTDYNTGIKFTSFTGTFPEFPSSSTPYSGVIFATADNADEVYSYKSGEVYRLKLASKTEEKIVTGLMFKPTDISPDASTLIGAGTDGVRTYNLKTGEYKYVAPPSDIPAGFNYVEDAIFSPDGEYFAYWRGKGGDYKSVVVKKLDGSEPEKIIRKTDDTDENFQYTLAWQPAPSFSVSLDGASLVGDLLEFDLAIENKSDGAFSGVGFADSGHLPGIIFNTAPFSDGFKLGFTPISGPAPALPSFLGANAKTQHQFLVGVDRAGAMQVRAEVSGVAAGGGVARAKDTLWVVAGRRSLSRAEQQMVFVGGYARLYDAQQKAGSVLLREYAANVKKLMLKSLPKSERKAAKATSLTERSYARSLGLADDSLSWLPKDIVLAKQSYDAFSKGFNDGVKEVGKKHLGSLYNSAMVVPWDYWSSRLNNDPVTAVTTIGGEFYDASAGFASDAKACASSVAKDVKSYACAAYDLTQDPEKYE